MTGLLIGLVLGGTFVAGLRRRRPRHALELQADTRAAVSAAAEAWVAQLGASTTTHVVRARWVNRSGDDVAVRVTIDVVPHDPDARLVDQPWINR